MLSRHSRIYFVSALVSQAYYPPPETYSYPLDPLALDMEWETLNPSEASDIKLAICLLRDVGDGWQTFDFFIYFGRLSIASHVVYPACFSFNESPSLSPTGLLCLCE